MEFEELLRELKLFLSKSALEFILKLIGAFALLFVGLKLIKLLKRVFDRSKGAEKLDPTVRSFIESFGSFLLKALLIVMFASIVGVPTTSLIALLGSVGVAIGLAMQGSLSNLAGGVMILLFKPFHKGDFISVPNVDGGTVTDISIFYTTLVTVDNHRIVVPNGIVSNSSLTNYSVNGTRRVELDFSAPYAANSETVRQIILSATQGRARILPEPAPDVILREFADSAVVYQLRLWVNAGDYVSESAAIRELVKRRFDEAGLSIPFPQLDVYVKEAPASADRRA